MTVDPYTRYSGLRRPSNGPTISLSATFFRNVLPSIPALLTALVLNYPMDENDQWGDCVLAALDHYFEVVCKTLGLTWTNWTRDQILAYYRTQNPDFDPNGTEDTNGPGSDADGGMDIQTFLNYLVKQGLLLGFGKVPVSSIDAAVYCGVAIVTGETLVQANESQKVWDVPGGSEIGGHCTDTVGFDPDEDTIVSWGALYGMTKKFVKSQVEEAWFPIPQVLVDHPTFRANFDLAMFGSAFTSLTGKPFNYTPSVTPPVVTPPVVVPPVTPPEGASFPGATVEAAAHLAHRAAKKHMTWVEYLNWLLRNE